MLLRGMVTSVGLALALMSTAAAAAAAAECGARPAKPGIPTGESAQIEEMKGASSSIEAYVQQMDEYSDCLVAEAKLATEERNQVVENWNAQIDNFNTRLAPQAVASEAPAPQPEGDQPAAQPEGAQPAAQPEGARQ